jgi:hypothetical protein
MTVGGFAVRVGASFALLLCRIVVHRELVGAVMGMADRRGLLGRGRSGVRVGWTSKRSLEDYRVYE